MPRVPFFNSHGEGIDVFVEEFKQTDRLDDGFVLPVDIERDLGPGESMGQTESGLFELYVLELFVFEEIDEVLSETADDFVDDCRGSGLNGQLLVN